MRQHRSGWVGAVVLALVAVSSACGSRDNLFVLDDEPYSGGGTTGHAGNLGSGNVSSGGHAGTLGLGGYAGTLGFGGHGGNIGVAGHGGNIGVAGGSIAFGGGAGFGASAGSTGFSCAACLASDTHTSPCSARSCNFARGTCDIVPINEGGPCFDFNSCATRVCQGGECVQAAMTICPASTTPCQVNACDPTTGLCVSQPSTGNACDDGDPCTIKDQCTMGACTPGPRINFCQNGDKCCPAGCVPSSDSDCSAATQVVISTSDRGWYQDVGGHEPENKNTLTGFGPPNKYNSFFSFDLSGVSGTVVAAQLVLEQETFYGVDMSETASIWDVSTNSVALSSTRLSTAIFADLQSGNRYGTFVGTPATTGTTISTNLSARAVSDINAARGSTFSVGVHVDTLSGQMHSDEGLRFSAGQEVRKNQLILTVQ